MASKGKGKAKANWAGAEGRRDPREDENYKNQLNKMCQRMTGESMGKEGIVYDTKATGGGFQATVTLACLNNEVAAGEVSSNAKEAEQSAAMFCMVVLQAKLNAIGQSVDKPTYVIPPAVEAAALSVNIDTAEGITDLAMRAMLHETIKQAQGRNIEKGDILLEYANGAVKDTFVAQLKLPNVPGVTGFTPFIGMESAFKKDTYVHASMQALDSILSDPDLASNISLVDKIHVRSMWEKKAAERRSKANRAILNGESPKGKGNPWGSKGSAKGSGKGKGKGKGGKTWEQDMVSQVMAMPPDQLLLLHAAMEEMKGANSNSNRSAPYW